MSKLSYIIKKSWYFAWHRHHFLIPFPILKNYIKSFFRYLKTGNVITKDIFISSYSYSKWRKANKVTNIKCSYKDLITIIYPIISNDNKQIEKTIESIMKQKNNIFLLIGSKNNNISKILNKYDNNKYKIISYDDKTNKSFIYNDLLKNVKSNYVTFINDNMILDQYAFNYVGNYIKQDYDVIYTDEDMIFNEMYCSPIFKPDWALDSFLGDNYLGNFVTIKKSLIKKVGTLNLNNDDYTFKEYLIRCISNTNKIGHIPFVLFHDYSNLKKDLKNDKDLISNYLKYNNIKGKVVKSPLYEGYYVKYNHNNPLVSVIIPFKNQFKYTKDCVDSIISKMKYKNYELVLVDNGSDDLEMLNWLDKLSKDNKKVIVLHDPEPFNFASICNYGVKHSHGDYYLFLNNDTKIIDGDFLDWMVGYASQKHIGAVGLKLLFEDEPVQHMGVVLSTGCYANHYGAALSKDYAGHFNMFLRPYNFSAVTGACLMISKVKFKEVKGFDEKLAIALNDIDLCIKLLDMGYQNVCLNNIQMFHFESKSRGYDKTKEKSNRLAKEYSYLQSKWIKKYSEDKYVSKYFF